MEKEFYNLTKGDYIQSGDEWLNTANDVWKPITKDFFGRKYGYNLEGTKLLTWPIVRREVPAGFKVPKFRKPIEVKIEEQWGEDFEVDV